MVTANPTAPIETMADVARRCAPKAVRLDFAFGRSASMGHAYGELPKPLTDMHLCTFPIAAVRRTGNLQNAERKKKMLDPAITTNLSGQAAFTNSVKGHIPALRPTLKNAAVKR